MLRKVRVFKNYYLYKSFFHWRRLVRTVNYRRVRKEISRLLFQAVSGGAARVRGWARVCLRTHTRAPPQQAAHTAASTPHACPAASMPPPTAACAPHAPWWHGCHAPPPPPPQVPTFQPCMKQLRGILYEVENTHVMSVSGAPMLAAGAAGHWHARTRAATRCPTRNADARARCMPRPSHHTRPTNRMHACHVPAVHPAPCHCAPPGPPLAPLSLAPDPRLPRAPRPQISNRPDKLYTVEEFLEDQDTHREKVVAPLLSTRITQVGRGVCG